MGEVAISRSDSTHWLAYWTADGTRFYPINLAKILNGKDCPLKEYSKVMNRILSGEMVVVEASYNRKPKSCQLKGVTELSEVEVTVKLPKAVFEFLHAMHGDVAEYLANNTVRGLVSYIECVSETRVLPETFEGTMEKYGLTKIFKQRGILPSYYNL